VAHRRKPRRIGEALRGGLAGVDAADNLERGLAPSFAARWRGWLKEAVEDPDVLWASKRLRSKGVGGERLVVHGLYGRTSKFG
jgi:hypothetical protein